MLHFDGSGLLRIQSLESSGDLGYLRIEPKMLGMLEKNHDEQRLFLRRDQFPEVMVDALLATEDRDFYQHDGVSPFAIARALVANVKAGRTVQGGSTLTQQLAKNIFLSSDRTLWRKIREAYIALIIDYRYSKDRILEGYLNEVYLGQSRGEAIHGFGLASRLYFGQPIQELRIDQLALLVGMVKGPSYYNPVRFPERAKERRDLVLRLMMQQGILSANQYDMAASRPLDIQDNPRIASRQPAYFQQLKIELKEKKLVMRFSRTLVSGCLHLSIRFLNKSWNRPLPRKYLSLAKSQASHSKGQRSLLTAIPVKFALWSGVNEQGTTDSIVRLTPVVKLIVSQTSSLSHRFGAA